MIVVVIGVVTVVVVGVVVVIVVGVVELSTRRMATVKKTINTRSEAELSMRRMVAAKTVNTRSVTRRNSFY